MIFVNITKLIRQNISFVMLPLGESSRGNTIRGNRTESLWEEICLWEGLWEDLWKPLKNLWKPLKNLWKPLKTSENLSKSLKTSKNLWKPLKNLWRPSLSETLSETLWEADFLSEALSPVAPILLPLKLSPSRHWFVPVCKRTCEAICFVKRLFCNFHKINCAKSR